MIRLVSIYIKQFIIYLVRDMVFLNIRYCVRYISISILLRPISHPLIHITPSLSYKDLPNHERGDEV